MTTKIKHIASNVITTTELDTSSLDSHFSGGTGVTYSGGAISIGQAVAASDSPTFADLTITGNLNITGNIDQYNVTDLDVTDKTITLGSGQIEANSGGSGIVIDGSNASILWDETNDSWDFNNQLDVRGSTGAGTLTHALFTGTTGRGFEIRTRSDLSGGQNSGTAELNSKDSEGTGGDIALSSNGNVRLFIDGGGNVGIGDIEPQTLLHLKEAGSTGAVNEFLRIENTAGGGAATGSSMNFHHYHAGGGPANGAKAASITAQNMAGWPGGSPSSYSTGLTFGTLHENSFDERMRIESSGKVGIGTLVPNSKLMVIDTGDSRKQIEFGNHATYRGSIGHDSQSGRNEYRTEAGGGMHAFFKGATSTTPEMIIDNNGNVGIGTDSPYGKLQIEGNTNGWLLAPLLIFSSSSTANSAIRDWSIGPADTSYGYFHINQGASTGADPRSTSNVRFTISDTGKVGIGEAVPDFKLHVKDTNTQIAIESTTTHQNSSLYYIANGANQWETGVNISAGLDYEIYDRVNNGSRMVVQHDGKIRIGNNIPMWSGAYGGALVLKGNNATSDRYAQLTVVDSSGSIAYTGLIVNNTGKVGIGTTNPSTKLTVKNDSATTSFGDNNIITIQNANTTDNSRMGLAFTGNTNVGSGLALVEGVSYDQSHGHTSLNFSVYNGSWHNDMMVLKAGNVGINTSTPLTKLQVVHTAWSSGAPYGSIVHIDGGSNHDNNWGHLHVNQAGTGANTGGRIRLGTSANNGSGANPIAGITALNKDTSNGTYGNLEFSTRPSGGTNQMRMELSHNGHIKLSGDHGIRVWTGYFSAGTSTANFDVSGYGQGVMMMTAAFNHYGFIQNYGCYKRAICSNGPGHGGTSIEVNDVDSAISTNNGGSWTFQRQSGTQSSYRITKNAGTYAGGGYYWVRFEGNMGV